MNFKINKAVMQTRQDFIIRALTESDLPHLLSIEAETQIAPWSREVFEKFFQTHNHGWVIVKAADQVIGFILVSVQIGECHILNICIASSCQQQGYGTQLLSHALDQVKQEGAKIAYLEVRSSNEVAIALYKKMGFKKIGERKNYYPATEGREDAWVFAQDLG